MRFGSLTLKSNLFLSPLAGYTNLPFRLALREIGGLDLATTDLVNARSLLEQNPKALKLIETAPADQPPAVQLFGAVPGDIRDAALLLESMGIAALANDIGCPVRRVCRGGRGPALTPARRPAPPHARGPCLNTSLPGAPDKRARPELPRGEASVAYDHWQKALDRVGTTFGALNVERGGQEKIWGSMIKQALKRRNPGFNETYHGFRSFNSLLEEAAIRGLLRREHDEKSGGCLVTPPATDAA